MKVDLQEQGDNSLLIATFQLRSALFGIDAQQVQEIVRVGEITPVHHAPPYVAGIRNLRGRIVTVLDLRARLELGSVASGADNRILIVDWQGEPIGLLVDSIAQTILLNPAEILPPPPNVHGCQRRNLQGICHSGDRLLALLDAGTVLQPEDTANQSSQMELATA